MAVIEHAQVLWQMISRQWGAEDFTDEMKFWGRLNRMVGIPHGGQKPIQGRGLGCGEHVKGKSPWY